MRPAWLFVVAACGTAPAAPSKSKIGEAPAWFVGAWKREYIQELGGSPKDDTLVRDLQTSSVFGSVRILKNRPVITATSFDELTDEQLQALVEQNGFSGIATFQGDVATWNHEIDFQPPSEPDIGRIRHTGPSTVVEEAPDRSYTELWWSMTSGDGKYLGLKVTRGARVEKILTVVGDQFVFARNRAHDLPRAESLADLVAKTHPPRDKLVEMLDCEFAYGVVHGGRVPWEIRFSTLPWHEGKSLAFADEVTVDGAGAPKPRTAVAGESWAVPVNTLSRDDLRALFPR